MMDQNQTQQPVQPNVQEPVVPVTPIQPVQEPVSQPVEQPQMPVSEPAVQPVEQPQQSVAVEQPVSQPDLSAAQPVEQPVTEMQAAAPVAVMPTMPTVPVDDRGSGGKKLLIGVIVLILMLVSGGVGAYFYVPEVKSAVSGVMGSAQPTPLPIVQKIEPTPTIAVTPTPATIEEEVMGVDVGDVSKDLQDIDADFNQL